MINLSSKKTEMEVQCVEKRIKNFNEVALGYSSEQAVKEACRCLNCKHKPCVKNCPVSINIPAFIEQIKLQNFKKSFEILNKFTLLPAVCGRVCPQELQCEKNCVRGQKGESVAIGRLERFVADWHSKNVGFKNYNSFAIKNNKKKVAVVGSGPAGLTCAGELAKFGFDVVVFEALHEIGGVLIYGVPEFRLPKKIVKNEICRLQNLGVKFKTNILIGTTISLDDLFNEGFCSVFIGAGAGTPKFLNIAGENLNGIYCANEFLTRINLMKAFEQNSQTPIYKAKKFIIIGGGNVAIDSARCAKRLGKNEVEIVYRRGFDQMPARLEEIEHARQEGVVFRNFCTPIKFIGEKFVEKIICKTTEFKNGELVFSNQPEFEIKADGVVIAIGTNPNSLVKNESFGVELDNKGRIIVDSETFATSRPNVYAGGDVVSGAATVILAMQAGKKAAQSICEKFSN